MIFAYNKEYVGDVLLVVVSDDRGEKTIVKRNKHVAKIMTNEGRIVAWNIFDATQVVGPIDGAGQIQLTKEQLNKVNRVLKEEGFSESLVVDKTPKLVVGYVKSCKKHPNSDHLSITQTDVGSGEVLQIVCGAPNIKAGQKVVVAKVGMMMPDGLVIWPGNLRGVESFGMICSAKELLLETDGKKKGILELPFDAVIGAAFSSKIV